MINLTLTQAAEGCLLYKSATGCSPHTILDYRNGYNKLLLYLKFAATDTDVEEQEDDDAIAPDDPPFASITRAQLVSFFAWLQNSHISEPDGVAPRGRIHLAPKSIYNIHVALSALWTWGVQEGYVDQNLIRTIDAPQFEPPAIEPFSKEDIQAMLKACDHSRTWKTRQHTTSRRPTADRDRAIILLLLDTGIRRSELCALTIADLNLTANSVLIRGKGAGRDKKERIVYFGRGTARALWRYVTPRLQSANNNDPVFPVGTADYPREMKPDVLRRLLKRIGDRAGVAKVHPHRFRHTFAITYLRNQGDPFTLQILLGHSDLSMVKRYLKIVRADCADAHGRASPVDNWRL